MALLAFRYIRFHTSEAGGVSQQGCLGSFIASLNKVEAHEVADDMRDQSITVTLSQCSLHVLWKQRLMGSDLHYSCNVHPNENSSGSQVVCHNTLVGKHRCTVGFSYFVVVAIYSYFCYIRTFIQPVTHLKVQNDSNEMNQNPCRNHQCRQLKRILSVDNTPKAVLRLQLDLGCLQPTALSVGRSWLMLTWCEANWGKVLGSQTIPPTLRETSKDCRIWTRGIKTVCWFLRKCLMSWWR